MKLDPEPTDIRPPEQLCSQRPFFPEISFQQPSIRDENILLFSRSNRAALDVTIELLTAALNSN